MELFGELLDGLRQEDRVPGVITGIVKENWDKKYPGMVKAEYFLGEKGKSKSGWMPVAMPYASNQAGMYFLPEIGTEVVIAFQMGDKNCPIVIGSLWNQETKLPDETAKEKNTVKRMKTKGGHEIVFSEEEKKEYLEIHTPGGMKVRLDDGEQAVTVSDKDKKNTVTISAKNGLITIDGEKKLELSVGGKGLAVLEKDKVSLSAGAISIEAGQGLTLKGQSLSVKGSTVEIKGDGSLKAESGGVTQIKGSMVKIN